MNYADKKEKMEEEVSKNGEDACTNAAFSGCVSYSGSCYVCLGVRVFVEPKALFHVVGTTMDFQVRPSEQGSFIHAGRLN